MKFRFFLLSVIVCCGLLMQCCKTGKPKGAKFMKETHLTKDDSGKTIRVKSGSGFEVTLHECVGCAEVWQVQEIDREKLDFLSNTYSGRSCKNCNGGSQDNSFHFKVLKPGTSTLILHYFSEKFSITVEGY